MSAPSLENAFGGLQRADLHGRQGRVSNLIGLIVEATGVEAEAGEICRVDTGRHSAPVPAEAVGFRDSQTLLMPLGKLRGIGPGAGVEATGDRLRLTVGADLLGRVVDGLGRPIDGF